MSDTQKRGDGSRSSTRCDSSGRHGDTIASPMLCYALRLRPGQELKGALAEFTSDKGIRAGFVLSCVGSVRDVVLRLAGAEHQHEPMLRTGVDARFEVVSLVGTLSPDGLHLHASLGDETGAVCGGHLVRAIVHTTAELVIGESPALAFSRVMDPRTGYKELVVSERDVGQRVGDCGVGGLVNGVEQQR